MGAGGSWSGRCRCSGCRGWLSGLRPRRASGPAPMSGDLLIPARAAPSCVPELEIPGSAEPSRQAAYPQNTVGSTSFRHPESRSVTVAEDRPSPARFPRGSARECGFEPPRSQPAFAFADGQKSTSTDLHTDVAPSPGCWARPSLISVSDALFRTGSICTCRRVSRTCRRLPMRLNWRTRERRSDAGWTGSS
jgi:hypothetical protein